MKEYRSKKAFKEDLINLSAIEIYEEVLSGRYIKIFPAGFWQRPEAKENAKDVTKYLIEEKLKWNDEDIKNKLNTQIFIENKLYGMLNTKLMFNKSPYKVINNAYPDKFKPWELKSTPNKYWNKGTAKEATKWLIEEKLKWNEEDIKKKINNQIFIDNGLHGMLKDKNIFKGSPYKVINNAYPDKFKPWELNFVPNNYWNKDSAKEATIWLIENKLKWTDEDIKENLNQNIFINNGLIGMIDLFNRSPYEVINNAYPGKFKKSDLKNSNYYNL